MVVEKSFFELMGYGISVQGKNIIPVKLRADETEGKLLLRIMEDGKDDREEEVCGPREGKFFPFCVDGIALTCELPDGVLHYKPEAREMTQRINPWISVWDGDIIRLQKDYAEHNLSPVCLELASERGEDWYDWYTIDNAAAMLFFELPHVFQPDMLSVVNLLNCFCGEYVEKVGLHADNLIDRYRENYRRSCWEPESDTAESSTTRLLNNRA